MRLDPHAVTRVPGFLGLWATGSLLGSMRWMEILAVGVYALAESGSAFVVAAMLFVRTAPMVVLGAFTGALADRVPRRTLLGCGVALMALVSTGLAALALAGTIQLWHVALGALLGGSLWTMEHPVRRALIHDVVGNARLAAALGLDSATFNGTRLVGPLVGGALYASLGLAGTYCAGALAYLLALACVLGVPDQGRGTAASRAQGFLAGLAEGLRHVRGSRDLSAIMWITVVANLFGFSYVCMVPVLGTQVLSLDARGIGALMSMEGLGAMLGALVLSGRARPAHYWRIFLGGAASFLLMIAVLSQTTVMGMSMLALFLAGVGMAGFGVMQSTIVLACTPAGLRSRVMGVLAVCIGTAPIGILAVGAVAEQAGAPLALLLSACLGLLALAWVVVRAPHLLRATGVS